MAWGIIMAAAMVFGMFYLIFGQADTTAYQTFGEVEINPPAPTPARDTVIEKQAA